MGISIYYSGMLRNPSLITAFIHEASDIANSHHWDWSELPIVPEIPIRGIIIQPADCDPVFLTFHRDGYLCNPILFSFLLEHAPQDISLDAKQYLVTKTQYAGAETHMQLIRFLRFLSEKYFNRFELTDDSQFWESGDENYCRKRFGEGERIQDLLDLALESYKTKSKDNAEIFKDLKQQLDDELGEPREGLN